MKPCKLPARSLAATVAALATAIGVVPDQAIAAAAADSASAPVGRTTQAGDSAARAPLATSRWKLERNDQKLPGAVSVGEAGGGLTTGRQGAQASPGAAPSDVPPTPKARTKANRSSTRAIPPEGAPPPPAASSSPSVSKRRHDISQNAVKNLR